MTPPPDYLGTADVWTILDLIVAEWTTDPQAGACFDARIVERAKQLIIQRRVLLAPNPPVHVVLTHSQLMALRSLVLHYTQLPGHTEVFIDVVRDLETHPEDLLVRLMYG